MIEKLKIKVIYDDFLLKIRLSEEQIKILNMLLNKESITKISMSLNISERTVSYEIRKIKDMFNVYLELEKSKLNALEK